jgi:hypothetical protein
VIEREEMGRRERWPRDGEALKPKTEIGIKSVLEMELMRWGQGLLGLYAESKRERGQERKGAGEVRVA